VRSDDSDGERPLPIAGLLAHWSEPLAAAIQGKSHRLLYNRLEHWGGLGFIDGGGGNSRKVEVASRNINKPARLSTGDVFDTVPVAPSLLWIAPPVKLKRISTRVVAGKRYSIALG
jgi:hypothetical protein